MNTSEACVRARRSSEAGLTLIETTIALAVLFIATAGIMGLAVVAIMTTENQGHLAARTVEYGQDKIEQLMSLAYRDGDPPAAAGNGTDTFSPNCVQYLTLASCTTGGSGLRAGAAAVGTAQSAGSINPDAPVNLYVDYLDRDGNPLGSGVVAPGGWFYKRVWRIQENAAHTMKTITVVCRVRSAVGNMQSRIISDATLVTIKSKPF